MLSKPQILTTSSTKSASPITSPRQGGTSQSIFSPRPLTLNPRSFNISKVFCSGTSTPVKALIRLYRSVYVRCHAGSLPCTTNSLASPPHISKIILVAISDPHPGDVGSRPLSKRYLASLIIFNFRPVDAVLTGSKIAASRNIFAV